MFSGRYTFFVWIHGGKKKKNGEKKENMSLVGNLRIQKLELKEFL